MPSPTREEYDYVKELCEDFFSSDTFTYYTETYGCQQNVSDTERLGGILESIGFTKTTYKTKADLLLVNSCAVRENAEIKFLSRLGELKPLKMVNSKRIIILCGCMFSNGRNVVTVKNSYPFVDIVSDTNLQDNLVDTLADFLESPKERIFPEDEIEVKEIIEGTSVSRDDKFNVSVPIMYGCDNHCSYCIVPYVRGSEVNRNPEDIISEVEDLVKAGAKHINLLGQNVNAYGRKLSIDIDFVGLLKQVCAIPGNFIVSFLSSHPRFFTRELIDFIADEPKMCRMLHIPFQSGSDSILTAMGRGYTSDDYMKLISYAQNRIKGVGISSDIIVGFPGETEVDFDMTIDLVHRIGFYQLFTYIFSKRPGTPAAKLVDDNISAKKTERMERLLTMQKQMASDALARFKDSRIPVLFEKEDEGTFIGRYGNFLLVKFAASSRKPEKGELCTVFITGNTATSLAGIMED